MTILTLGWKEWLSLPLLDLPAMEVKVDTGAKTSALHAFDIEPFGPATRPLVRFGIRPVPDNNDIEVFCSARVIDRRAIVSSNGETEQRYIIETSINIAGYEWPIEISLSNRESMRFRMLLGRQALGEEVMVNPTEFCLQPTLSYELYKRNSKKKAVRRSLRLGILTIESKNYSSRRLVEAAEARDHVIEMIDTRRCYMNINSHTPEVHYDGQSLAHYDAIIPRIGASLTSYGMSVVRQFSMMGSYCVNPARAIGASRDKLYAHQLFARHKISMPITAFANSPKDTDDLINLVGGAPCVVKLLESTQGRGVVLAENKNAAESVVGAFRGLNANFLVQEFVEESKGADIRCFVIGGRVVAAMERCAEAGEFRSNLHRGGSARSVKISKQHREIAVKACRVLGLNVAGVDLLYSNDGPKVLEVNSSPGLEGIERVSGKDIAGLIIEHIEKRARPISQVRPKVALAAG